MELSPQTTLPDELQQTQIDAAEEKAVSESQTLTEEQKAAKLEEIRQKMAQRRAEREKLEKAQQKENERIRRMAGKELSEVKKHMEEKEMSQIAEAKKREKAEEKAAKARILAQIEADRRERQMRQAKSVPTPAVTPAPAALPPSQSDATSTRLQIRLPSGKPVIERFEATEKLSAVREILREKGVVGKLGTTFPRKFFDEIDYDKSLKELNLVPSAVLVVL